MNVVLVGGAAGRSRAPGCAGLDLRLLPADKMSAPPRMSKEQAVQEKGLMPEEYDEIANDFDEMDTDKSGFLDFEEVVKMVAKQSGVSEEEATELAKGQLKMMDTDGDEKISFNEYINALC